MVPPAQHLISDRRLRTIGHFYIANHDDIAFEDHDTVGGPRIVGCPLPAPAQRLDLERVYAVGKFDKSQ
jgi:hypothetical protein